MRLYVGNLPFSATEASVRELFERHGKVESVALLTDRDSGHIRGFGFLEMPEHEALRAIAEINGQDVGGRQLRVSEARPRPGAT